MKKIILLFLLIIISCETKSQEKATTYTLRKEKISEIKNFLKNKNFNQDLAIFIDFKIPSGKFRMFIYDLRNNKILGKGIVSHGSGSVMPNSELLQFSNTENSYQSSLGKYEILNKYEGKFGTSYRLKGLDKTNSNAYKRAIVIHALSCVPDTESSNDACLSLGCPMLSPQFFKTLEKRIDASKKPIIMFAFY